MKIKRFIGGSLESNGYVISTKENGSCYIIDPGYEPKKFIDFVEKEGLNLLGVILTHHHHDHVGGAARIRDYFGVPVMMHEMDVHMYRGDVDRQLRDGDALELDGQTYMAVFPAVEDEEADEEDLGLVILKSIMVDGEEQLSTLDSDEELDRVYDLFMEQLMEDEEEDS